MRGWGLCWAASLMVLCAPSAHAHGGGLNREGCHNDRRNGGYHCHRGAAPASPAPEARRRSYPNADANPYAPARYAPSPRAQGYAPAAPASGAYRNCSEARAAGAAPVRRGDPGYGPHLDRDNDGIGCEPYRAR